MCLCVYVCMGMCVTAHGCVLVCECVCVTLLGFHTQCEFFYKNIPVPSRSSSESSPQHCRTPGHGSWGTPQVPQIYPNPTGAAFPGAEAVLTLQGWWARPAPPGTDSFPDTGLQYPSEQSQGSQTEDWRQNSSPKMGKEGN